MKIFYSYQSKGRISLDVDAELANYVFNEMKRKATLHMESALTEQDYDSVAEEIHHLNQLIKVIEGARGYKDAETV